MSQVITARLSRNDAQPWGFRLQGGKDFGTPLVIQKVSTLIRTHFAACSLQKTSRCATFVRARTEKNPFTNLLMFNIKTFWQNKVGPEQSEKRNHAIKCRYLFATHSQLCNNFSTILVVVGWRKALLMMEFMGDERSASSDDGETVVSYNREKRLWKLLHPKIYDALKREPEQDKVFATTSLATTRKIIMSPS